MRFGRILTVGEPRLADLSCERYTPAPPPIDRACAGRTTRTACRSDTILVMLRQNGFDLARGGIQRAIRRGAPRSFSSRANRFDGRRRPPRAVAREIYTKRFRGIAQATRIHAATSRRRQLTQPRARDNRRGRRAARKPQPRARSGEISAWTAPRFIRRLAARWATPACSKAITASPRSKIRIRSVSGYFTCIRQKSSAARLAVGDARHGPR